MLAMCWSRPQASKQVTAAAARFCTTSSVAPSATMPARVSSHSTRSSTCPHPSPGRCSCRCSSSHWSQWRFDSPLPREHLRQFSPEPVGRAPHVAERWSFRSTHGEDIDMTRTYSAALLLAACLAVPAAAQQPTRRQLDSLAAQVRVLRARLDSVLGALARQPGPAVAAGRAAAPPPGDDLAALRAAAVQAAGGDTIHRTDTIPTQFVGRERNQAQLNPEIGVTGDVRGYATARRIQRENFDPREFEIGFQSALDPYSHTKIFVSLEGGHVSVEEGYAYWTGLPGHIRLDLGKFRQQFGELNRWHLHAVPETEYPLALRTYLGDDGLAGAGVSLYSAFGGLGTHEVTAQVTRSESDAELFGGTGRPTYLLHLLNFWQLTRSTYMQLGGTALYGTDPDSSLRTTVGGIDFRFTWPPPAQGLYREWTLRGELYALRKEYSGSGTTRLGWYAGTTYKLGQRLIAGARYDYVEDPLSGLITRHVIPSLTLWESEWVELRAQYTWAQISGPPAPTDFALQAGWARGPHTHDTYEPPATP